MTLTTLALTAAVKARATELGFDRVTIGPAEPPEHTRAFERWLEAGYAGTMDYLGRTRAERVDPQRLLPGVRSVVAVALSYAPEQDDGEADAQAEGKIARYARGRDYHDVMRPRLRELGEFIERVAGAGVRSRPAVDTSAVLERDLAARAGLGWIGKNTNLIDPGSGSYFFIGVVLTTAALASDGPVADHCGSCRACLLACPTGAFVAPYVLDARRCLAYLTIEHRGDIAEALRPELGPWVFGCDICQEVCPWNRQAAPARDPALASASPVVSLVELLALDEPDYRSRFAGTALTRAKRSGLRRNAALALAKSHGPRAVGALSKAVSDPDPVVSRAAVWALERVRGGGPTTH